ncbi:MAG: peptide deformylase [Alphaproteobacteria bacterium]
MALLPIVTAPDPRLKLVSKKVERVDEDLRRFMDQMLETMYAANGVGLAAIQVGVPKRVAVVDVDPKGKNSEPMFFVNPSIVWRSHERIDHHEGCLSVPEIWDDVGRHARVKVEYLDEHGKKKTLETNGLLAVALQHEIDHLNGKLFIDHLSKLKRNIALRKAAKMKRAAKAK